MNAAHGKPGDETTGAALQRLERSLAATRAVAAAAAALGLVAVALLSLIHI